MENNKTKDRVSFGKKMFNKTVKSMTWLMLVTLLVGTFAQPGSALAEEIGSNRVEKSVDSGSAVKQETKKYKKVDKTTDKKVHTPDTESKKSVEQSTEENANAPNQSTESTSNKSTQSSNKEIVDAQSLKDELVKDSKANEEIIDKYNLDSTQKDQKDVKVSVDKLTEKEIDKKIENASKYLSESAQTNNQLEATSYAQILKGSLKNYHNKEYLDLLKNSKKLMNDKNVLNGDAKRALSVNYQVPISVYFSDEVLKAYHVTSTGQALEIAKAIDPSIYALLPKEAQSIINSYVTPDYAKSGVETINFVRANQILDILIKNFNEETFTYDLKANDLTEDDINWIDAYSMGKIKPYVKIDNQKLASKSNENIAYAASFPLDLDYNNAIGQGSFLTNATDIAPSGQVQRLYPDGNAPNGKSAVIYCIMGNFDQLGNTQGAIIYTLDQLLNANYTLDTNAMTQGGPAMSWLTSAADPIATLAAYTSFATLSRSNVTGYAILTEKQVYGAFNVHSAAGDPTPFGFLKPEMAETNSKFFEDYFSKQLPAGTSSWEVVDYKGLGKGVRWLLKIGGEPKDYAGGQIRLKKYGDTADTKIPAKFMDQIKAKAQQVGLADKVEFFEQNGNIWVKAVKTTKGKYIPIEGLEIRGDGKIKPLLTNGSYFLTGKFSGGTYSVQSKIAPALWMMDETVETASVSIRVDGYFSVDTEKTIQLNGQEFSISELDDLDIAITETHVGLFKGGQQVDWSDEDVFTDDTKLREGSYVVNGQLTDSKPSSGPAIFAFSKDGKLKIRNIIWDDYELREVHWPTGTENRPRPNIPLNPDTDAKGEDDDLGVPLITLEGQDGFINTLIAFGFEAQKTVVMTGSQQEGLLATVGKDTQFTSGTHQSIINEKVDLSKAVFELQYADGTPVKTTDTMMKLFDPSKDLVKGTVVQHENVRFSPTKEGFLEVHHLVANDNETMKLVEVETPDRTNLDKKVITIQITSAPLYGQQPWQDEHYDSTSAMGATNGFLNNIDYTGVRLVKDINYLGTIVSNQAGTAYNPMDHSIGLSDFKGAQYTLFYGDGPKKDTPVNKSDYVAELIKYGAWNGATTTVSASGPIVFDVQPNGLVAILDNLIFGSYYLLETKAAPGLHLDKVKYYFGDEPASLGENEKYLEPTIKNANGNGIGATDSGSTNVSASKESKGVTVDDVKLVSVELEKRTKYLQTDSPFQTSETPSWSTGSKDVTYNHGDINVHYVNDKNLFGESQVNDLGSTRRNQAIYGLFYYTDTIDGQGKKGQPVKLTDKVVEHMKIINGSQVDKDYETTTGVKINGTTDVVIQLGEDARLKLEDIANGDYYLKELEAPAGLAIDPKEYIFGFNIVDRPTYVGNGTDNVLNKPESQTQDKISTVDTTHNYHFDNTFDNGKFGSTDVLLTFGFSSAKTFDSTASENGTVGENGVTMKLSPIDGTLGDPITTVTKKETLKDPSGKLVTMNGFYEFRTVPIGTWLLTSESNNPELLEIDPIIVRMFREDDGDYTLEFYTDVDHKGTLEDNPGAVLLTRYTIKEGDPIPTQGQLDQLASNDEIKDGYGPGKNGADVDEGEDHVWQRPDNKDVDKDPSKNHNFISAEVNMDYAGFETIDKIEPDDKEKEIGTTAYNEVDGGKFVNADKDQTIIDIIDLSKYTSKTNGEIVTVEAAIPTIPYTNGIVENEKDPISIDGLKNEDITEPTVVLDSKGNKAIALPSKKVEVIRTEDQEKEGLKDNQFVFNKGMKEVKVKVSGIDLTQFKPGQKVVMFEKLVDTKLVPAIHADINSESQTVIVKPSIGTQFFVANNGNVDLANIKDEDLLLGNTYMPGAKIKAIDYVKVTGAKVGVPTKFVARLHTKDADGNIVPVLDGKTGQPIVGESEIITPTKSNFIVPVYLEFVAPKDVDKIVAFEQGYEQNKETEEFEENEDLVHEDIDDEGQTIVPKQPEIRTKAQVNGDNVFTPSKETPMHDDIQVTNAAQNAELEMKIKLWKRTPDGKGGYKDEVVFESAQDIVIATDDEKYAISTIVDTSKDVDGTLYVWTEELHDKEAGLLAEHNDLNNKDQTVRVKNPKTPKTPTKKPGNGFADTGSKVLGWAVVTGIVIIVAAYFLVRKKKETDVDK